MSTEPGPDASIDSESARSPAQPKKEMEVAVSSPALNEHSFASSDYSAVPYSEAYSSPRETHRRSSQQSPNADDQRNNPNAQSVLLSLIAPPSAAGHVPRPFSPHFGSVQIRKVQLQEGAKSKLQDGKAKKKKKGVADKVEDALFEQQGNDSYTAWQEEDKVVDIMRVQSPSSGPRTPADAEGSEKGKETPLPQSRQRSPASSRPSSHSGPPRPSSSDLLSRPGSRQSQKTRKALPSVEPPAVQQRAKTPDRKSHQLKTAQVELGRKRQGLSPPKVQKNRGSALFSRLQDNFQDMDRPFSRMLQELSPDGKVSRATSAEFTVALSVLGETTQSFLGASLSRKLASSTSTQRDLVTSSDSPNAYTFLRRENSSHHIDPIGLPSKPLPALDGISGSTEMMRNNLTWPSSSLSLKLHAEERRRRHGGAYAGVLAAMLRAEASEGGDGGHYNAAGMPQHSPGSLPLVAEDAGDVGYAYERDQDADVLFLEDNVPEILQDRGSEKQELEQMVEQAPLASPLFDISFELDYGSGTSGLQYQLHSNSTRGSIRHPQSSLNSGASLRGQQPELITRSLSPQNSSRSLFSSATLKSPIASHQPVSEPSPAAPGPTPSPLAEPRLQPDDRLQGQVQSGARVLSASDRDPRPDQPASARPGVTNLKPGSAQGSRRDVTLATHSLAPARPATVAGTRSVPVDRDRDRDLDRDQLSRESASPRQQRVRYQSSTVSSRRHSLRAEGGPRRRSRADSGGRAQPHVEGGEIPNWFLRQLAGLQTEEDSFLPPARPVSVCLPQRRREVMGLQRGLRRQSSGERLEHCLHEEAERRRERRRQELRTPPAAQAPSPGWSRRITAGTGLMPDHHVDLPELTSGPGSASDNKARSPQSPGLSVGRAGAEEEEEEQGHVHSKREGGVVTDIARHDSRMHAKIFGDARFLVDAAKHM